MTKEDLKNFHRRRLQVLAGAGPDLIAFETIPNKLEAQVNYIIRVANVFHLQIRCRAIWLPGPYVSLLQVYAELLEENGIRIPAWFSFTSKDGVNAASGDPINECAAVADSCPRVDAVGVNCTAPRFIHGLILSIKKVHHSRSLLRGETNTSIIWNSWQLNLFPGDEQADRRVSEQRGDVRRGDERMGGALAFVTN